MTRVAMFHPTFEIPGGAETLCLEEAEAFRSAGDDVTIVTIRIDEARWRSQLRGFRVLVTPRLKSYWSDALFAGRTSEARRRYRYRRVARPLRGFDVVLAHNYPCNSLLGASELPGRKVWQCNEPPRFLHFREANPAFVAWVASLRPEDEDDKAVLARANLAALFGRAEHLRAKVRFDVEQTAHLDHIYAISEFSRDNARRIYGRCGEEVVYPIVRFPQGGRKRAGLDRTGLGVLVLSRLELLKNVDTVVRGFASFFGSHPTAVLHVVGDGAYRGALEKLAASLLPAGACVFHGYVTDEKVREIADRCDVFALLPFDEPFGLVYPEAAARGLLLVGPDHGGPVEILDGGRLGKCVAPTDPEALAAALAAIAGLSDAEADRLREAADQACRARYERSVIAPQLRRIVLDGRT